MEQRVCERCGMPMVTSEEFGTNKDGSLNQDYCTYCYKDGDFTSQLTMEQFTEALISEKPNYR